MNGHSGCNVYLCEKNSKKYVRKTSSSIGYNSRLKKQMEKQSSFAHDVLLSPEIYKYGYINGLFYFDMQFIRGVPMHNYVSLNSSNNIIPIVDKVFSFLQNLSLRKEDITDKIHLKLSSLNTSIPAGMSKYSDYCAAYDWSSVAASDNHGDLTFENILIYRNKIYLIDFLDSFVQTKYIDYAKLLQDIVLDWSWRHNMNKPLIKTIYLYNRMLQMLSPKEIEITKRLLILNLLRIVPYSNDSTFKYLENRLNYLSGIYGI